MVPYTIFYSLICTYFVLINYYYLQSWHKSINALLKIASKLQILFSAYIILALLYIGIGRLNIFLLLHAIPIKLNKILIV